MTTLLALAQAAEPVSKPLGLTTQGLVFMATSIAFVVILVGWCFKRVLTAEPPIETDVPAGKGP